MEPQIDLDNNDTENNKVMEDSFSQHKKKLTNLLLPKKDWHVNHNKGILTTQEMNMLNEKQFYKTSRKGFAFNRKSKPIYSGNVNMNNQKRIRSSTLDKQKLMPKLSNKNAFDLNNNNNNFDIEQTFMQKINEIKKELENNENTFVYNQKIMQKKINEKDKIIAKLTKDLEEIKENSKKESENNIAALKKNYINTVKELTKENNLLKNKNDELTAKNLENEDTIHSLETKNKTLMDEINNVNQKYNIFIANDEKQVFDDEVKELIQGYNDKLTEEQNEINSLNEELRYLNQENKRLKSLTKEIIEARNETEIFFLDALNEVKKDLYKLKKEKDKRGSFFPTLKKNYEDNTIKVDIRALTPEMRERILRNLFEKINRGYDENKFKELNNIMAADISDDEEGGF